MDGIRLVIFDYDGTLFDTRPAIVHCMGCAFEQCGRTIPTREAVSDAVRTGATLPDTLLLLDPGLRHDPAALGALVLDYRRLYHDQAAALLCPYPGVAETILELNRRGLTCVIVSNKGVEAIRRSFDATGLGALIDYIIGDHPDTPKKPDPAVITDLIAPRYGLHRHEMLIVGDTELDLLFAKRTGITSCWASYGYGLPAQCRALAPDHEISDIRDLREIIAARRLGGAHRVAL